MSCVSSEGGVCVVHDILFCAEQISTSANGAFPPQPGCCSVCLLKLCGRITAFGMSAYLWKEERAVVFMFQWRLRVHTWCKTWIMREGLLPVPLWRMDVWCYWEGFLFLCFSLNIYLWYELVWGNARMGSTDICFICFRSWMTWHGTHQPSVLQDQ